MQVIAINNQGVFESAPSRDSSLQDKSVPAGSAPLTTIQQVVPSECEEWHHNGYRYPQTCAQQSAHVCRFGATRHNAGAMYLVVLLDLKLK